MYRIRPTPGWCILIWPFFVGLMMVKAELAFKMTPTGDIFLLRGTSLELNCTVKDSSYDVRQMGIGRYCKANGKGEVANCTHMDDRLFSRIGGNDKDERTLSLKMSNISLADDGKYTCYYGNPPMFQTEKIVHVGDLPGKPENLSCISYNFDDLRCTASLQTKPSDIPMKWQMNYSVDGEKYSSNCTVQDSTIICEPIIEQAYINQDFRITLVGYNENFAINLVSETFLVQLNYSLVKPGPVANLQVQLTNTNSREAKIAWVAPPDLFTSGMNLRYRIELVSLQNWAKPQTMYLNKILKMGQNQLTFNLTGLIPHASYNISVSCKPNSAIGDIYWSDPLTINFTANIDIPGQSVKMVPGSFSYMQTNNSGVGLVLYWKNPPDKQCHGDINRYQVDITESQSIGYSLSTQTAYDVDIEQLTTESTGVDYKTVSRSVIYDERQSYIVESEFNSSLSYTLHVRVGNAAGFSARPAEIYIPTWSEVNKLLPNWVLVEMDSDMGRTLVSWDGRGSSDNPVVMATVYWCDAEQNGEFTLCKDFDWLRVKSEDNQAWINESSTKQFAVSLETANNVSGGVVWQNLQFTYNRVPEKPTYSVNPDPLNGTVLHVTVTHGGLESNGGRPNVYEIAWDELAGSQDTLSCPTNKVPIQYPVDFSQSDLELTDLQPGVEYVVCMRCVNDKGSGQFGKPVRIRTSAHPADENGYVVVLSTILGSVAVLGIGAYVIYWCRRKIKSVNLKNQIEDIEIPEKFEVKYTEETVTETNLQKPVDYDSGTGTGSTSSTDSQQQDDSGEGFEKPRSWSLVSTENAYNQVRAKRRNSSSSGILGYIRVDGDTSGLTIGDENDSLIGNDANDLNTDHDEEEKGESNDYFKSNGGTKNVYHEIDDIPHDVVGRFDNTKETSEVESSEYVLDNESAVTVRNPTNPDTYTDTVPPRETQPPSNHITYREGTDKLVAGLTDNPVSPPQPEGMGPYTPTPENNHVPNNTEYSSTRMEEKSKMYIKDKLEAQTYTASPSVTEYSDDIMAAEPLVSHINYHARDDNSEHEPNIDTVLDECVQGDIIDINKDNHQGSDLANTTNTSATTGATTDDATSDADDFDHDEYSNDNFNDNLDQPYDTYCDPESISLGQESTLSSDSAIPHSGPFTNGDIDNLKSTANGDSHTIVTDVEQGTTDAISISDAFLNISNIKVDDGSDGFKDNHSSTNVTNNLAKTPQNSVEKQNGFQNIHGDIIETQHGKASNVNENHKIPTIQSDTKDKLSESGQSYDAYVCARLNRS